MKATPSRRARSSAILAIEAIAAILGLALAGCDSYSLLDQFVLPDRGVLGGGGPTEPLTLGFEGSGTVVGPNAGIALTPSGGVPPYSYSVQASAISPLTLGWHLGMVSNNVYSSGNAIGKVMIIVTDAASNTDNVVVTVLPLAPTLTVSRVGGATVASVSWDHPAPDGIDGYQIERRASDETVFTLWHSSTSTGTKNDTGLDPAKQYTYRIVAQSGDYYSAWTEKNG